MSVVTVMSQLCVRGGELGAGATGERPRREEKGSGTHGGTISFTCECVQTQRSVAGWPTCRGVVGA